MIEGYTYYMTTFSDWFCAHFQNRKHEADKWPWLAGIAAF